MCVLRLGADIPQVNQSVAASARQGGAAPRHGPDPCRVTTQSPNLFALDGIPQLHFPPVGAHRQVRAPLRPRDRRYDIFGWGKIAQFGNLGCASTPKVHTRAQTDRQDILRRPVNQIEIKVILQGWGIKDLKRDLLDASLSFLRRRHESLARGRSNRSETKGVHDSTPCVALVKDVSVVGLSRALKPKVVAPFVR